MLLAHHKQTESHNVSKRIEERGGLASLVQDAAKAEAGGTLGEFFKQLLSGLTPIVGALIQALIMSLLHLPSPAHKS